MKKFILTLFTLSIFLSSAYAKDENIKIIVNKYLHDLASSQIEESIPKGQYSLTINVDLSHAKLEDLSGDTFKLPMGNSSVTGREIGLTMDANMTRFLEAVKKIEVNLGLPQNVPTEVRTLLTKQLSTSLYIDSTRGDSLVISDLSSNMQYAWDKEQKVSSSVNFGVSSFMKKINSIEATGMIVAIGLILAALTLFGGMQFFGRKMGQNAAQLVKAVENFSENSNKAPALAAVPTQSATDNAKSSDFGMQMFNGGRGGNGQNEFFKNVDKDTLLMFVYDCMVSDQFVTVPLFLTSQVLDAEKARFVEANLPKNFYEDNLTKNILLNEMEVESLLKKNYINYKKCAKGHLAQVMMKMNQVELEKFFSSVKGRELIVAINNLLPMQRERYISSLSIDKKFEMAQLSQEKINENEVDMVEKKLVETANKILVENSLKIGTVNFKYLEDIFLTAGTFEEDEVFFKKSQALKAPYTSVLSLLSQPEAFWADMNLNTVAYAYFGYSETVKTAIVAKFAGKQQEWLKHFIKQAEAAKFGFKANEVVGSHKVLKEKLPQPAKVAEVTPIRKAA